MLWGGELSVTAVSTPQTFDTVDSVQAVGAGRVTRWVTSNYTFLLIFFLRTHEQTREVEQFDKLLTQEPENNVAFSHRGTGYNLELTRTQATRKENIKMGFFFFS